WCTIQTRRLGSELNLRSDLQVSRLKDVQRLEPGGAGGRVRRVERRGWFARVRRRANRGVRVERIEDIHRDLQLLRTGQLDALGDPQIDLGPARSEHRAGLDERYHAGGI